jgi:hypothetical protein
VEQLEDRLVPSTLQAISLPPSNQLPSDTAAGASISPSISQDGNYVAFQSDAPNLVPGQTGGLHRNVFLLERSTGTVTLVSRVAGPGNATRAPDYADSWSPIISADGRHVIYESWASEVVDGMAARQFNKPNVVEYDRITGVTSLVSHNSTSVLQASDFDSNPEAISADGRFAVFQSTSTNVVAGQQEGPTLSWAGNGPVWQYFLYDRLNPEATRLITHSTAGPNVTSDAYVGFLNTVADDGTVAYVSGADNIAAGATSWSVYVFTPDGTNHAITPGNGGVGYMAMISRDGSSVAYVWNLNIWRYDRHTGVTTLLSAAAGAPGTPANGGSGGDWGWGLGLNSATGRFVVFASDATNLLPGQTGSGRNLYLYDAATGQLALLSGVGGSATAAAGGVLAKNSDTMPSISADGSLIAYGSTATNLLAGQSNTGPAGTANVFVYHRLTGQTTLITGVQGSATATGDSNSSTPQLSADGSVLAFQSQADNLMGSTVFDANGVNDVFTYGLTSGSITLVSRAAFQPPPTPGMSFSTSVSADGRYTAFTSTATNLVPAQINAHSFSTVNVFLYDRSTGTVHLVNHIAALPNTSGDGGLNYKGQPSDQRPDPALRPMVSADGSTVAFVSYDNNLVPGEDQSESNQFPWLTLNHICVYLYDVSTGTVRLVNHASGSAGTIDRYASSPALSADGRYVAYVYGSSSGIQAGGPIDQGIGGIALYDSQTDTTTLITTLDAQGNGSASNPGISDDGRYVSYLNQGNVYVYDRTTGQTTLISSHLGLGAPANGPSTNPVINHDGHFVAFVSQATDLVTGQVASPFSNVFLYNIATGAARLVSGVSGSATVGGNGNSDSPAIDGDGSYVAYRSDATNLVPGQSGGGSNIFEFNAQAGSQTLVSHQVFAGSTAASGNSSQPVIDDDGHLISYTSTAPDLVPGQSGPTGIKNVFVWLRQTGANILASGQDGSPTLTGNADSDGPLLTRDSFPGFSSAATNLLAGVGGSSVAYINTLFQVVLSPNLLLDGSAPGTVVGSFAITSLLAGQYMPPTYRFVAGEGDNTSFHFVGNPGSNFLFSSVAASYATRQSYQVVLHVDIGFGDYPGTFTVQVVPPPQFNDNTLFVSGLYHDLLGRASDQAGIDNFQPPLDLSRDPLRAPVARTFVTSSESRQNLVVGYYQTFLNRIPGGGEVATWLGALAQGWTPEQVAAAIISSGEDFGNQGSSNNRWLAQAYQAILGRAPDPGAQGFLDGLNNHTLNRSQVANAITGSLEHADRLITQVYATYLGRLPDPAGQKAWEGVIMGPPAGPGQPNPDEQFQAAVIASPEYFNEHGASNPGFVASLYTLVLGRQPDPAGFGTWLHSLVDSYTGIRQAVALALDTSLEYRQALVRGYYTQYLGRSASVFDVNLWTDLLTRGARDEDELKGILSSDEYFAHQGGTNALFVAALYRDLLGRPADPAAQSWVDGLNTGRLTRSQVVASIGGTLEHEKYLVGTWFQKYLGRSASDADLTSWARVLETTSDEQVQAMLLGSFEYMQRGHAYP